MKKLQNIIGLLIISIAIISCNFQSNNTNLKTDAEPDNNTSYDSVKAMEYEADDYGMKVYVMAFLKKGPNQETDVQKANELMKAHLKNINRLAEEGKLVLAGPFIGNDDLRGIYLFDVSSIAEAEALTQTDPAIQAGSLTMVLTEWYGSAALMEVNKIHKTIMKREIFE